MLTGRHEVELSGPQNVPLGWFQTELPAWAGRYQTEPTTKHMNYRIGWFICWVVSRCAHAGGRPWEAEPGGPFSGVIGPGIWTDRLLSGPIL